jgi:hypothetical protein
MTRFWVLALAFALPGCFPPAVTIASLAADGASYATSGRTVSDHGLSVATARDCKVLMHAIEGKPVCVDRPVEASVAVEDRRRPQYFVVVGSYAERANADHAAQRYAAYSAEVVRAEVSGREFHRVVVGPVSAGTVAALAPDAWKTPR